MTHKLIPDINIDGIAEVMRYQLPHDSSIQADMVVFKRTLREQLVMRVRIVIFQMIIYFSGETYGRETGKS